MLHWRSREIDLIAKSTPHHPAPAGKNGGTLSIKSGSGLPGILLVGIFFSTLQIGGDFGIFPNIFWFLGGFLRFYVLLVGILLVGIFSRPSRLVGILGNPHQYYWGFYTKAAAHCSDLGGSPDIFVRAQLHKWNINAQIPNSGNLDYLHNNEDSRSLACMRENSIYEVAPWQKYPGNHLNLSSELL